MKKTKTTRRRDLTVLLGTLSKMETELRTKHDEERRSWHRYLSAQFARIRKAIQAAR